MRRIIEGQLFITNYEMTGGRKLNCELVSPVLHLGVDAYEQNLCLLNTVLLSLHTKNDFINISTLIWSQFLKTLLFFCV